MCNAPPRDDDHFLQSWHAPGPRRSTFSFSSPIIQIQIRFRTILSSLSPPSLLPSSHPHRLCKTPPGTTRNSWLTGTARTIIDQQDPLWLHPETLPTANTVLSEPREGDTPCRPSFRTTHTLITRVRTQTTCSSIKPSTLTLLVAARMEGPTHNSDRLATRTCLQHQISATGITTLPFPAVKWPHSPPTGSLPLAQAA